MNTITKNKKRFRNNLQQFIELKEAGKLNGSAAQIKQKLKGAANVVDLDFLKEYKAAYKDVTRKNPKVKVESKESTGGVYEPNRADQFWDGDTINVDFKIKKWHTDPKKAVREFKLSGIEFGNWLSEKNRTEYLVKSMQGLHNLSKIFGINHSQIGFKEKLGIAFGARGRGPALAHYEGNPTPVINLTKEKGQNSLAHEYGHSLDNALSAYSSQKWITGGRTTSRRIDDERIKDDGLAGIAEKIFKTLYYKKTGEKSDYYNRLTEGTEYERRRIEVFARCVDMYVTIKCKKKNISTDHLSHKFNGGGVTPTTDEMGKVLPLFDKFFKSVFSKINTRKNPGCGCNTRTNPETDTVCVDDITCDVTVKANTNDSKGGIEIRFSDAPPKKIREQLKDADFTFYTPKDKPPFWAAEITKERKELAERIAGTFDSAVLKGTKKTKKGDKKKESSTGIDYELGTETTVDFKADGSIQKTGDYAIVEIRDVQASHNKDCSQNSKHQISRSQPRDRSKEALCAQPSFIAKNLNPASITQGNLAFVGAPVSTDTGQIIQGNGRTISLKIAYDEIEKSAQKYRKYLLENASDFGLSKRQINQFDQPVLVRMLPVDNNTAIELGNVVDTSQAKMSTIDQAKAYIRNLSDKQLLIIGKLIQESSGETIGAIIDEVGMDIIKQLKQLDRTSIVEKNKLTSEGKEFLRSVLVGLVFDGEAHPNALHHYMKLPHRIKAGLERSFGYIIPLIGNPGDITDTLARAVEVAAQTYQSDAIDTAKEYAASQDMFEAKDFSKTEVALAQFLLDADTQKFIRNGFRYYDELLKGKENLFGKTPPKSKNEAFNIVFIDRARPNPETYRDDIVHDTIVRAQRLQTLGNDNSADLEKLDYLLGKDGWKWNAENSKIVRLDNEQDRFTRLKILTHFRQETGSKSSFEQFKKWLQKNYPEKASAAQKIWESVPYGAWRSNPGELTADVKQSVLDDFYAWIEGNPLMDYTPGAITFKTWIQYHYPGYEDAANEIWDTARPMARANPTARFIRIGICDKMMIDQGKKQPTTLQGPHGLLTNKAMDKLFIVPFSQMDGVDDEINDLAAEQVFAQWHNYAADDTNYEVNWPDNKKAFPVGTADSIYYVSDKVMREYDGKGKMNVYHHDFDAGKRPCVKKGQILIVSNLDINENGILN